MGFLLFCEKPIAGQEINGILEPIISKRTI
jgi:hypothetical protein